MILGFTVFSSLLYNVYLILTSILQSLNKFKLVYLVSIIGFATNGLLDVPLMYLFNSLGMEAFYGAITSTIIGYTLSLTIGLVSLHKSEGIQYKNAAKVIVRDFIPAIAMVITLVLLNRILPFNTEVVTGAIITIAINIIVGGIIFIYFSYKLGILSYLLGKETIDKLLRKLRIKRTVE